MSESYRALVSDHYVNMKLQVKMELPRSRETVLDFFERLRRQFPSMSQFRRYKEELALESAQDGPEFHRWVAVRTNSIRAGAVNTDAVLDAYAFHTQVLDTAPFFLNVSPIDVEFVELLFGFDLMVGGNQDAIVYEALYAGSPIGSIGGAAGLSLVDCQPVIGFTVADAKSEIQAHVEVKTHPGRKEGEGGSKPISLYLTLRRFGAVHDLKDLRVIFEDLTVRGEGLLESQVVPKVLIPIRQAAGMGG